MNRFTELLKEGRQPLGMFIESCSPYVVEATGQTGLDYIILDNEHSPIDAETSAELIRAAELAGLTPFCRVREISRSSVLKLLDVGAQGLIVPNVKTAEEVKNLVKWAKYAPIGERGFCPSRKDGFGWRLKLSVAETMAHFNREVLLIPQCETSRSGRHFHRAVRPFDLHGHGGRFRKPGISRGSGAHRHCNAPRRKIHNPVCRNRAKGARGLRPRQ